VTFDAATRREAEALYAAARIGFPVRRGGHPAVLVVDFSNGFTDPACALGCDLTKPVLATKELLDVSRANAVPVLFTTIAFDLPAEAGNVWLQKAPSLAELALNGVWVEIDARLERRPEEPVIVKKGQSAFFGTNLASQLVALGVDTVVLCGASTSGCIRATAIDLVQYGWPAIVPRECVGDRALEPHEANLFDINAKLADVVPFEDALAYLASGARVPL
jgi:N-formylmaleamate deformylase